jgi:hypothetical protein
MPTNGRWRLKYQFSYYILTKLGVIEVRFEVLAAMAMTGILFRCVMLCGLLQVECGGI